MKIFQPETAFLLKMKDGELKFESEDEKKSRLKSEKSSKDYFIVVCFRLNIIVTVIFLELKYQAISPIYNKARPMLLTGGGEKCLNN